MCSELTGPGSREARAERHARTAHGHLGLALGQRALAEGGGSRSAGHLSANVVPCP